MSEKVINNPVAQEAPGLDIKIFKHHVSTRIMHFFVALGFIVCGVSGICLFAGAPIPRGAIALLHCIMGVVFIGAPVIYIIVSWRSFSRFMDTCTHYDKDDLGWITAPMGGYLDPYLFRGKPEHYVPPQDKYNTGQKLAGLCLILGGVGLAITGFLMWANTGDGIFGLIAINMGPGMTWFIWTLHFVACVLMLLVFAVHFFLGAVYPVTNVEFGTMFGNGIADYGYTKKKHGKWIEELELVEEHEVADEADAVPAK